MVLLLCCAIIRSKIEDDGIHTIAFPRWRWSVIEQVPEMRTAATAQYFYPVHPGGSIGVIFYSALLDRFKKAGPTARACKLCVGTEQWIAARGTVVCSNSIKVVILAGKSLFGRFVARDLIDTIGQNFFPDGIGKVEFSGVGSRVMRVVRMCHNSFMRRFSLTTDEPCERYKNDVVQSRCRDRVD